MLLQCPFCGDVFQSAERDTCPECGVLLRAPEDPPPAAHAAESAEATLPWYSPAGGRGIVVCGSIVGLGLFFAPWLSVHTPANYEFSGFDLATTRGFWFSGGAIAWVVLLALVLSRHTLDDLAGVRLVAALLASFTAWQTLFVLAVSRTHAPASVSVHFTPAFYASGVLSVALAVLALRLGRGVPKGQK
jgi:hypothetical protein